MGKLLNKNQLEFKLYCINLGVELDNYNFTDYHIEFIKDEFIRIVRDNIFLPTLDIEEIKLLCNPGFTSEELWNVFTTIVREKPHADISPYLKHLRIIAK